METSNHLCSLVQINLVSREIGFRTLPSPLRALKKTSFLMTYQDGALYFCYCLSCSNPTFILFSITGLYLERPYLAQALLVVPTPAPAV